MECPRCNFNQPDDKYCANCGLDVEAYKRRPVPIYVRILQDPNFYAFLFGGILIAAAGYIFINQRSVSRQVGKLFHNTFIMSKDARVKDASDDEEILTKNAVARSHSASAPAPAAQVTQAPTEVGKEPVAATYTHLTVRFFELSKEYFSKENVAALNGKVTRDDGEWRVVYFEDAKTLESLKTSASRLPGSQEKPLATEGIELDAGDTHPDMQLPYMAIGVDLKGEAQQPSLHFAIDMQVPQGSAAQARNVASPNSGDPNTVTDTQGQPQQPAQPAAPMAVTSLEGTVKFKPQGAVLLIYDPPNRAPASTDMARLGQSPLHVYTSDDFRLGYSDLIVWISFK